MHRTVIMIMTGMNGTTGIGMTVTARGDAATRTIMIIRLTTTRSIRTTSRQVITTRPTRSTTSNRLHIPIRTRIPAAGTRTGAGKKAYTKTPS